jgi:circadian clock protein KaiB
MSKYILRLFISGRTIESDVALGNVRRICERDLGVEYELEVIDVLERPSLGEEESILATPMLVLESPAPIRRIAGDLSDRERVLFERGIHPPHAGS